MRIRQFLLCVTLCVVCSVTGCGKSGGGTDRYFAYRDTDLCAEVSGTLYGMAFCAEIGQTYADGSAYIRYMSPDVLSGVCLRWDAGGRVTLEADGIVQTADEETLAGLLLPLQLLLRSERAVQTVQKHDGITTLTLSEEITLVLSKEGIPTNASAPNAELRVAWWESK